MNVFFTDISELVFNERLKCLDPATRSSNVTEFIEDINQFLINFGKLVFSAPIWKLYPTQDWRRFEVAGKNIHRLSAEFVRVAQEKLDSNQSEVSKNNILSQMLERKEKYGLSMKEIVALMADLLIGGVDSVSFFTSLIGF
jgi:hypothetical protein